MEAPVILTCTSKHSFFPPVLVEHKDKKKKKKRKKKNEGKKKKIEKKEKKKLSFTLPVDSRAVATIFIPLFAGHGLVEPAKQS